MRLLAALCIVGCGSVEPGGPPLPVPLDVVWANSIHAGDMFVLVPGTGSYGLLAEAIDPLEGAQPDVDVRTMATVASDAIVFEQAIGAAHRAGIPDPMLEDGTIAFAIWGVGFKTRTAFTYVSYEGLRIPIHVLGGTSKCAVGSVPANLLNYNTSNAASDAGNLYARTQAWLAAQPNVFAAPRNVIVASHSWGGAVAEYLAFERVTVEAAHGPLVDSGGVATPAFTIAAGVPAFIPSYHFAGPGLRDVADGKLYEVDRPDDPVHVLDPSGNGDGHQYDILFGDDFQGSYGVTTDELSCAGVPGPCS